MSVSKIRYLMEKDQSGGNVCILCGVLFISSTFFKLYSLSCVRSSPMINPPLKIKLACVLRGNWLSRSVLLL